MSWIRCTQLPVKFCVMVLILIPIYLFPLSNTKHLTNSEDTQGILHFPNCNPYQTLAFWKSILLLMSQHKL